MPMNTAQKPDWSTYADTLITRLRKVHGVHFSDDKDDPSELDILFQKFEGPEPAETFSDRADLPSRYVPARQLLSVIRLAATIGSPDAESAAYHCGAITVISGIAVDDLVTITNVVKDVFPSHWEIIAPEVTDGEIAMSSRTRVIRLVRDNLDKIKPLLILQADGLLLPKALLITSPVLLQLTPVTHDVMMKFLENGHFSDQISGAGDLRAALPTEAALRILTTIEICAALRAPVLHQAVERLGQMAHHDVHTSGPRLEDMRGDSTALTAARRIVTDLQDWKAGKARWHEISRSLLLFGAPGTGKTWLARAMANSAGLNLVTGTFGEWQAAGHLGDMLREMRATFAEARRKAPCVLVIDEIDAVGSRDALDRHSSNYRTQVITTFLTELDQIARQEGVIVVGTCNHIERIDPAVLRAGRMDIKIEVLPPDADAILEILRFHLSEDIADHDLRRLSRRAVGKTAADIDAAIRAARSDARHARSMLSLGMLETYMDLDPRHENRNRTWRIAVHEAGHAVVARALQIGEVKRIMITDLGGRIDCLMHTSESRLSDIETQIAYSMAGRAAERLILGEISAGAGGPASSDLALATRAALNIETTYGMGLQGPVWHENPGAVHLTTPAIRDRVLQRITQAEARAGKILQENAHYVETLARHLVEHRSLKAEAINRLLDGVNAQPTAHPSQNISA
ncbi:AAA family ATPase [Roseovarius mucosus]|uniref:AAA family ATPase n=1 Tax=Roseovarius mucosus TaxID=215743 RepID=UPI003BABC85D